MYDRTNPHTDSLYANLVIHVDGFDRRGLLITGFFQIDGDGWQNGSIVAGDGGTLIIQIAEVTNIGDAAGCIAAGTHEPERVAAIALNR